MPSDAARIVAADESAAMLDELAKLARGLVTVELIEGRWPDVAERVAPVDVVVCAHVLYNVKALAEFATALHVRARRRVVVEFTAVQGSRIVTFGLVGGNAAAVPHDRLRGLMQSALNH